MTPAIEGFGYYVFVIAALAVALILVKKITGCLIKAVIMAVIIAALAAVYFLYFA